MIIKTLTLYSPARKRVPAGILLVVWLMSSIASLSFAESQLSSKASISQHGVIPTPRIEEYGKDNLQFSTTDNEITVSFPNGKTEASGAVKEGYRLFNRRLRLLADLKTRIVGDDNAQVRIQKCDAYTLLKTFQQHGVKNRINAQRLQQSYFLQVTKAKNHSAQVTIKACSNLGVYYALVSLCQLVDTHERNSAYIPTAKIVDWPEMGLRLAKASASFNPVERLQKFAQLLSFFKINLIGLQFHGGSSKQPDGNFLENIKTLCSAGKSQGVLESIVYFGPFRGGGKVTDMTDSGSYKGGAYNFRSPEDREKYAAFLLWMLDQGADGIEIDYNDWPGKREASIEAVISFSYHIIKRKRPDAYVLYCPPSTGPSRYWGPATPGTRRILSKVPRRVWPLWTGMGVLTEKPLKPEYVQAWTKGAGRRPFLWLNRVTVDTPYSFSYPIKEVPGAYVFRGEFLPKELNRLFIGIHFNCYNELPKKFPPRELAYFATAADYVWNPHDWNAVESCKRARRLVEIMLPLVVNPEENVVKSVSDLW